MFNFKSVWSSAEWTIITTHLFNVFRSTVCAHLEAAFFVNASCCAVIVRVAHVAV